MRKILVTGGAGYVGGHAAKRLEQCGFDVIIYDNLSLGHRWMCRDLPLVVGDIRDENKLRIALQGCDAIMHFAALAYVGESVLHPRKYFETNVNGSLTLLGAALELGIKHVVFSSTCAIYGIPDVIPISDSIVQNPVNPYGDSKLFVERALTAYSRAYGMHSVSLRYFNAAGADEEVEIGELHCPETHLIPSCLEAIEGKRGPLEVFGTDYPTPDGTCIRDYIHVTDLAEAHVRALHYLTNGGETTAFNVGTGVGHSVLEVIRTVEQVTGQKVPLILAPRRCGDPPMLVADPSRSEQVLNWRAARDLRHIVTTAWNWYRSGPVSVRQQHSLDDLPAD